MRKNILAFAKDMLADSFEETFNLLIFFPYFFSVGTLLKTLFSPWKSLVTRKTVRGFSFSEWINRLGFNLISRMIGFVMRVSILLFFFILEVLYIIAIPAMLIFFILSVPMQYLLYLSQPTEDEYKARFKLAFVKNRLLKEEHRAAVETWFETYYAKYLHRTKWWKLPNLFTYPPLARDWAVGYTPILDEFAEDLCAVPYQARIKSIVNRKKEIAAIEQALSKNTEANVLVVGEEGVGKHTVVDALAKRIYEGQTNPLLAYKRVLKLNMEKILTVYTDQKQREAFLEALFAEASEASNTILMIENLDKYVAFGSDRVDLSGPLEKYGKTAAIQFIGVTNPFFYQRFVFGNDKINRIFTKVDVEEISSAEAVQTLLEVAPLFESRNRVLIPYETILNTVDKSEFYITYIPFPEKAIELLDASCSWQTAKKPPAKNALTVVLPEAIDAVLSEKTHIPTTLTDAMREKLVKLEDLLGNRVIHQEHAITLLSSAMRRSFILLGKRKKPLASFLFLGPTGVGKTETAKALADIFFGGEKFLVRFDMSLYQNKTDIRQLIGSIDSGVPGQLVKAIRENPYAVLLLDEIEKADRDLLNIFLTLLDEGYFTDGFGKKVDCKNLIVIATSNAGADFIFSELAKSPQEAPQEALIKHLIDAKLFSPEFLNRFDGVVTYKPVTEDSIGILARRMVAGIASQLYKLYKIHIDVTDTTLAEIIRKGYNPQFGARNLERVITQDLEDRIARLILEKKVAEEQTIRL